MDPPEQVSNWPQSITFRVDEIQARLREFRCHRSEHEWAESEANVTLEVMVNGLDRQCLRILKVCHGEALEMEKFAELCWGHICELDPGH
jgi:hypothetical protein